MTADTAGVVTTAIVAVETSDCEIGMSAPRCGDILRCLRCGSTWSLIVDGIVRAASVTMMVAPVAPDRIGALGAGVAWFGCDDCKLCREVARARNKT